MENKELRYVRMPELRTMLGGVSKSTVLGMIARNELPQPFKLGARIIAWREDEIKKVLHSFERVADHSKKILPRAERNEMRRTSW